MLVEERVSVGRQGPLRRLSVAIGLLAASLLLVRWLATLALRAIDERSGLGGDLKGQLTQLAFASITVLIPLLSIYFVFLYLRWCKPYAPVRGSITALGFGFLSLFIPLALLFLAAVGVGSLTLAGVNPDFGPFTTLWSTLVVGQIFLSAALEEVVFRGILIDQIRAVWPQSALAVTISAVLFGFSHYNSGPDQLLARTTIGIGLGWSAVRLGSIAFPIGAHFGINLGLALLSPGFGRNSIIASQALTGAGGGGVTGYWQGGLVYCMLIVAASEVLRWRSDRQAKSH